MQALQYAIALVIAAMVLVATFGGGGLLLWHHAPAVVEGWQSRSWPAAPAVIRRSEAIHKYSPSGWSRSGIGTHVVRVAYEFETAGRWHQGTRRSLDDEGKVLSAEHAQKAVDALPPGRAVTAHYDPGDPGRSLLQPGVPVGGVLGSVMGMAVIGTGIGFVVLGFKIRSHHLKRRARKIG